MHPSAHVAPSAQAASLAARPAWGARTRATLAVAAAALLTAWTLATAPTASAHDSLIGSTPDSGATVTEALDSVELNFSGDLKPIGNEASLQDADGKALDAETSVDGRVLTVDFGDPLPAGDYTLTWRVVSSDGHPIEGTTGNHEALVFTVANAAASSASSASAAPTSPAASSPAAAATPSAGGQTQAPATASAADAQPEESTGGLPTAAIWIIIAVAVLAAAGIVFAKARRQDGLGR